MRFQINSPKDHDERIRKYFAVFPVRVVDEIRWLEWVVLKQTFYCGEWDNAEFLN